MRNYILLGALIGLAQMPALSQDNISTNSQSIQGTWISQVADPSTGAIALFEVGTFSPDDSYSGANVNASQTTHKGVWLRTGDRKFVMTVMFFTHDDKGIFNGIVKARGVVTLSEDGKSFDSVVERVIMDTNSKELSVTPGIKGRSVRMDLEMQRNPQ